MDEARDLHEMLERFARELDPGEPSIADVASGDQLAAAADEIVHLKKALLNRTEIGQAQGILIERYGLDADHTFAVLTRVSQHTNRKLIDICRELIETGDMPKDPTADL